MGRRTGFALIGEKNWKNFCDYLVVFSRGIGLGFASPHLPNGDCQAVTDTIQ
jgi:hypothetical protein